MPCSRTERISTAKVVMLPKAIYRFNTIAITIAVTFFEGIEPTTTKFIWNHKTSNGHSQSNPKRK